MNQEQRLAAPAFEIRDVEIVHARAPGCEPAPRVLEAQQQGGRDAWQQEVDARPLASRVCPGCTIAPSIGLPTAVPDTSNKLPELTTTSLGPTFETTHTRGLRHHVRLREHPGECRPNTLAAGCQVAPRFETLDRTLSLALGL